MAVAKAGQKQHVDYHRKVGLRQRLLKASGTLPDGAIYVPFCGDGDLAVDCYLPLGREIFACDLDPERVKTCRSRLPGHEVVEADAESFPFAKHQRQYVIADFDSYSYPYAAFRSWWQAGLATSPCGVFFTDGQRFTLQRGTQPYRTFGGEKDCPVGAARYSLWSNYWLSILEAFTAHIVPWRVVQSEKYLRGNVGELYWGAVIARPTDGGPPAVSVEPEAEGSGEVENALREAAVSGNVRAIELWLERHGKRPEPPVSGKPLIAQLVEIAEENLNGRT